MTTQTDTTEQVTYYTIRPTYESGDASAPGTITEFEDVQIQEGYASALPMAVLFEDSVFDALELVLQKKAENPALRLWYNGNETCEEFTDHVSFANIFAPIYGSFDVVEAVAKGAIPSFHQDVEDAVDEYPIIGQLVEKVDPAGVYVFTPANDQDEDDQDDDQDEVA